MTESKSIFIAELERCGVNYLQGGSTNEADAKAQLDHWKKEFRDLWFHGKAHDLSALPDVAIHGKYLGPYVEKHGMPALSSDVGSPSSTEIEPDALYVISAKSFFETYRDHPQCPFRIAVRENLYTDINTKSLFPLIMDPLSKGELPSFQDWWGFQSTITGEHMRIRKVPAGGVKSISDSCTHYHDLSTVLDWNLFSKSLAMKEAKRASVRASFGLPPETVVKPTSGSEVADDNHSSKTTESKSIFIAEHERGGMIYLQKGLSTKAEAEAQQNLWKKEFRDLWFKGKSHDLSAIPDFEICQKDLAHYMKKRDVQEPKTYATRIAAKDFFEVYQDYEGPPFRFTTVGFRYFTLSSDSKCLRDGILAPLSKGELPAPEDWWKFQCAQTCEFMTTREVKVSDPQPIRDSFKDGVDLYVTLDFDFYGGSLAWKEAQRARNLENAHEAKDQATLNESAKTEDQVEVSLKAIDEGIATKGKDDEESDMKKEKKRKLQQT